MMERERADAMRREKFIFVEHDVQYASELFGIDDGEQSSFCRPGSLHAGDVRGEVGAVCDEPLHAASESGQALHEAGLEGFDGE